MKKKKKEQYKKECAFFECLSNGVRPHTHGNVYDALPPVPPKSAILNYLNGPLLHHTNCTYFSFVTRTEENACSCGLDDLRKFFS